MSKESEEERVRERQRRLASRSEPRIDLDEERSWEEIRRMYIESYERL